MLALFTLALGCPTPRSEGLIVNVQTDYIPRAEFDFVRVRLDAGENRDHVVTMAERFSRPRYVTTYQDTSAGRRTIEVSLMRGNRVVARRSVVFPFVDSYLINVILTRSCGALECATNESCFGRICVPDTCIDGDPTLCPPAQCTADSMCSSTVACVDPTCVAGACFDVAVDERCPADQYCLPGTGCVPRLVMPVDAAMPVDAYVPEGVDAFCVAASCPDDGNACTAPACVGGVCGFTPTDGVPCMVDDGNPCTQAVCAGGACTQQPVADGTVCGGDEGNPCTALPVCNVGACITPLVADGTVCGGDEGNPCTALPVCSGGGCTTPLVADGTGCGPDDGNECTSPPTCSAGGCIQPPVANGVACGAGDDSACVSGACTLMNTPENCGAFGIVCGPARACMRTPDGLHAACVAGANSECAGVGGSGAFMGRCTCYCDGTAASPGDAPPFDSVCATALSDGHEVCGAGVCHEVPGSGSFNYCATR